MSQETTSRRPRRAGLSVIIPAWNEEAAIAGAVQSAVDGGASEVLLVDGGSEDETVSRAVTAGARPVEGARGRGPQMNAGAAASEGAVLLFLHADCRLPADAGRQIETALSDPAVVAGGFHQLINAPGRRFRWLERGNAVRVRRWNRVYGDQAFFIRRSEFERLGGFPCQPLMEDYELSGRVASAGGGLVLLPGPLLVDARRWLDRGVVRQTATNWAFVLLYKAGVSPRRLARWYRTVR